MSLTSFEFHSIHVDPGRALLCLSGGKAYATETFEAFFVSTKKTTLGSDFYVSYSRLDSRLAKHAVCRL